MRDKKRTQEQQIFEEIELHEQNNKIKNFFHEINKMRNGLVRYERRNKYFNTITFNEKRDNTSIQERR